MSQYGIIEQLWRLKARRHHLKFANIWTFLCIMYSTMYLLSTYVLDFTNFSGLLYIILTMISYRMRGIAMRRADDLL